MLSFFLNSSTSVPEDLLINKVLSFATEAMLTIVVISATKCRSDVVVLIMPWLVVA